MLTLVDVRKWFGDTKAVDGLSLEVRPGEVFGLLGPNGAGKSTTVHLAVGLLAPDSGEVRVGDSGSPRMPAVRARLGVAPQALSLYEELTGAENLSFFGGLYGLPRERLAARVAWALDFVGLTDRRADRLATYSGGMKRRVNLAAALVHDPDLVLLDEPTVGVDPQSRNAIFDNILALKAAGRTIVYTTHYMEEAERLCDRVGIMDRGRLLAVGTVPALVREHGGDPVLVVRRPGREEVRLQTPSPATTLARLAVEGPVEDFHVERADLEQVFLALTGRRLRD